jgi:hypothetical protein
LDCGVTQTRLSATVIDDKNRPGTDWTVASLNGRFTGARHRGAHRARSLASRSVIGDTTAHELQPGLVDAVGESGLPRAGIAISAPQRLCRTHRRSRGHHLPSSVSRANSGWSRRIRTLTISVRRSSMPSSRRNTGRERPATRTTGPLHRMPPRCRSRTWSVRRASVSVCRGVARPGLVPIEKSQRKRFACGFLPVSQLTAFMRAFVVGVARRRAFLPRPEPAEPASMPREHGLELDENERPAPTAPKLREPRPEDAIGGGQAQARAARSVDDRKLMPKRQNLNVQRSAGSCR